MKILVTGGTGYIGSHTVVELLNNNYEVVIFDNLSNSKEEVVDKIEMITGKRPIFVKGDLLNIEEIREVFEKYDIDSVIHFAGLKAVGESVAIPVKYYENNIGGTLNLIKVMQDFNCKKMVFSSSATVYGDKNKAPYVETMELGATNPYGRTKLMIEEIFRDLYNSDNSWRISLLRYFNPVGAHKSGLIGEDPNGIPNNLMPYILKVSVGELPVLNVFGDDYDTPDGTGVRDYIHVVDLAIGHIRALEYIRDNNGIEAVNLGSGKGTSVLELVNSFEQVNDLKLNYKITDRRAGDIDICFADPSKAKRIFDWQTESNVQEMCVDSYNFIKKKDSK